MIAIKRSKVVMVYPIHGFLGELVMHAPISLLYASINLVKNNVDVTIQDNRLNPRGWKEELRSKITPETLIVGISVMSGRPIVNASHVSEFVRSIDPNIKIVWGGPHATFHPDTILQDEPNVDYVVSGYASETFYQLYEKLYAGEEPVGVTGISYKKDGQIVENDKETGFEFVDYKEIPYDLIPDYKVYGQLDQDRIIFSMYSVMGCPYKCSFCSSPAQYSTFRKKWEPLSAMDIVDHIEYVRDKYDANYIYFIDDDSFVNLKHVEDIMDEIKRRGVKIQLGFRGARVNEIKKMSHEFIEKLIECGTNIMHVGAESGSDRILELIRKNCNQEDILEINRKLAQHPKMLVGYNFIMGLPTETVEDLKKTRDLMLKLVEDNPTCILFAPNKFRPLPGTELFEIAHREYGYEPPKTLDDWAKIEVGEDFPMPWDTEETRKMMNLLLVSSYFMDNKIQKVGAGDTAFYRLARFLSAIYRPFAKFRLKHALTQFFFEHKIFLYVTRRKNLNTDSANVAASACT